MFPPKPTWTVDEMPDQSGKVMLVTGGNTGIGRETAKALLAHNAKVYIAGRSPDKVQAAIAELQAETGRAAHPLIVDLADLASIRAAAADFQTKETQLHVLFNSAGVMYPDVALVTRDGYDLQFGTNVLGHFYLTRQLMPLLLQTASAAPTGTVRIVHTSSMGHLGADHIDYDTLVDGERRRKKGTMWLYSQSKFGNVVVSNELHRMYADQGIVSIALHPGNLKTDLQRHVSKIERCITNPLLYPAPMGALTQLYAGTMPQAAEWGGKYMIPWARLGEAKKETNDPEIAKELWAWLESQVKGV